MTIQPPGTPAEPRYAYPPPGDDWNSPLWARPDTVASTWAPPTAPAEPPQGPPPPPRRSRGPLTVVAALVVAVLLAGAAVARIVGNDTDSTAAAPRPSVSSPAVPTPTPSQPPSVTPPVPSQGGQGQGGTGNQNGQGSQGLTAAQQAAVASVSPALVDIVTTMSGGGQGAGTGVVLTSDGVVLTNHHVVAGATAIEVTDVGNGKTYRATVLGYDRSHDIAVIRLTGASGLTTAPLGDSSGVRVGDDVVALGNAGGVGGAPIPAAGSVTALDQSITAQDSSNGTSEKLTGLIEVDAAIEPGDSGGALIDADGKVVGIVTAGSFTGVRQTTAVQGFAVPIDSARSVAQQILDGRSSSTVHIGATAFLGVGMSGGTGSASGGVAVAQVVPASAAAGAGIVAGDVITAVDATSVNTAQALSEVLDAHHPGDRVVVHWTDRSGAGRSATVTLGEGPVG